MNVKSTYHDFDPDDGVPARCLTCGELKAADIHPPAGWRFWPVLVWRSWQRPDSPRSAGWWQVARVVSLFFVVIFFAEDVRTRQWWSAALSAYLTVYLVLRLYFTTVHARNRPQEDT